MKGKRWVVTAAMLVAGIRLWMQVRGKTKTPFSEWVIGWGALFFFLSMMAEVYPAAAAPLAGTVVVSDFLVNGSSLFNDLAGLVNGTLQGPILVDDPFSPTSSAAGGMTTAATPTSAAPLQVTGRLSPTPPIPLPVH